MNLEALHNELMSYIDDFIPSDLDLFINFKKNKIYYNLYDQKKGSTWGIYYKWLGCLTKKMKFKNILELGTGTGASSICIFSEIQENSQFATVDLKKDAGCFIPEKMRNDHRFKFFYGNSINIDIYKNQFPRDIDFLFIDSLHLYKHVRSEFDLFFSSCTNGCLIVIDDIHSHDMDKFWDEIPFNKLDVSKDCHVSVGFGIFELNKKC